MKERSCIMSCSSESFESLESVSWLFLWLSKAVWSSPLWIIRLTWTLLELTILEVIVSAGFIMGKQPPLEVNWFVSPLSISLISYYTFPSKLFGWTVKRIVAAEFFFSLLLFSELNEASIWFYYPVAGSAPFGELISIALRSFSRWLKIVF